MVTALRLPAAERDRGRLSALVGNATALAERHADREVRLVARWMALAAAAATPMPADASAFALATDVVGYLRGAQLLVQYAVRVQDDAFRAALHQQGTEAVEQLSDKLQRSLRLVDEEVLPAIGRQGELLKAEAGKLEAKVKESEAKAAQHQALKGKLEKERAAAKVWKTIGEVFTAAAGIASSVGGVTAIVNGAILTVEGFGASKAAESEIERLDDEIKELEKEMERNAALLAALGNVVPLLSASRGLLRGLVGAGNDSLVLRTWLVSPAFLEFKTKLVLLSPESPTAAQAGGNLFDLLGHLGRSIVDALDKAEWYDAQRTVVKLTTPVAGDARDSARFSVQLRALRHFVAHR